MSQNISVAVKSRTTGGKSYYEGTVSINGLQPTKLVKADGCSHYSTSRAVEQAAERLATRLGGTLTLTAGQAPAAKQAAKKSAKTCQAPKTSAN